MNKSYPFKKGQRVMTPDGRGTVVTHDLFGLARPGIVHDVYPENSPVGMYASNILYYFSHDFGKVNI